jgi:uncharacterized protein YcgL (UPF0745 family)
MADAIRHVDSTKKDSKRKLVSVVMLLLNTTEALSAENTELKKSKPKTQIYSQLPKNEQDTLKYHLRAKSRISQFLYRQRKRKN